MRKVIHAVCIAFALGGASAAFAGEGCSHNKAVKQGDLEAPVPTSTTGMPEKKT